VLVRDHLPEHIKDLEAEHDKTVARLWEINVELAKARTMLAAATQDKPQDAPRNEERAPRRAGKEPNEPTLPSP
jgi:hypothetical protein